MDNDKRTKEYADKWRQIKLSGSARKRIETNLLEYARFHGVREGGTSRSKDRVPHGIPFFTRFNFKTMPVLVIAAVLVIGGGTSFAAEGSLPGDLLYPVKLEVNENIKSALAFSSEAEAKLQAELLEERIEEAEALEAEGRLEGETAIAMRTSIETQRTAAEEASNESRASVAVDTRSRVRLAINRFNALISDSSLAISTDGRMSYESAGDSMTMQADEGLSFGTSMMTAKEVVVEELRPDTEVRIKGLLSLIARYRAEINAELYAELKAQLEDGLEILERSMTETEEEAKNSVITAADIAGGVEGTLSTLGTVTIDENTGAIIEIDFSQKPEPILIDPMPMPLPVTDPANGGGSSGSTGAGASGSAGMDVDISDDMIEGTVDLETTTDLGI